jgi:hypothetical protein
VSEFERRRQALVRAFAAAVPPGPATPAPSPPVGTEPIARYERALERRVEELACDVASLRAQVRTLSAVVAQTVRAHADEDGDDGGGDVRRVAVPPLRLERARSSAFDVLLGAGPPA